MYEVLINSYVNKLTLDDINEFANKNGITLNNGEDKVIYDFIKNNWKNVYKGDTLKEIYKIKEKVSPDTFNIILDLYNKYKDKIR